MLNCIVVKLPERDLDHILQHTAGLWEDLRKARIFVTGGTGFFGTWLVESAVWVNRILDLGMQIHILTRDPAAFAGRAAHLAEADCVCFHKGDVRDFAFPQGSFTHVIHAATPTHSPLYEQEPETIFEMIVQGMRRALDFARESGAQRLLFTSSGAVYGRQPSGVTHVPEDFAGAPDHLDRGMVYAEGKRVAEQLGAIYHHKYGLHVTIARGFAFVGPRLPLDVHFAIGNFIRDGLRGGPIRVGGDGTPYRSYLYAADLTIWLWTILLRGRACRPYNVGSEDALSIAELARKVANYFYTDVQIARLPVAGAPPSRYVPCTARARQELALQTWIDLDEALDRTVHWQRAQAGHRPS
jgi:dTDP-glucose 4,6-dehydratase